jgi:hypothetical protein
MFATEGQIGGSFCQFQTRNGHFRGSFSAFFSPLGDIADEAEHTLVARL